jgi:hypothetical protein
MKMAILEAFERLSKGMKPKQVDIGKNYRLQELYVANNPIINQIIDKHKKVGR